MIPYIVILTYTPRPPHHLHVLHSLTIYSQQYLSLIIPLIVYAPARMATSNRYSSTAFEFHDDLLRDVHTLLRHPSISLDQQRLLCSVLDAARALREEARCSDPDGLVQDIVPCHQSESERLVYGSGARPLNATARRQNTEARGRLNGFTILWAHIDSLSKLVGSI